MVEAETGLWGTKGTPENRTATGTSMTSVKGHPCWDNRQGHGDQRRDQGCFGALVRNSFICMSFNQLVGLDGFAFANVALWRAPD